MLDTFPLNKLLLPSCGFRQCHNTAYTKGKILFQRLNYYTEEAEKLSF